jgi:hypothetical protein
MEFDQGFAALVAAGVAAVTSLMTLVLTARVASRSEMRAAHREIIRPFLEELGPVLHQIIASITIMRKRTVRGSDTRDWQARGKKASEELENIRRRTLYVFPGLSDGFRELTRATDHISTYKALPDTNVDELVDAYQILVNQLHATIASSYRKGLPRGLWHRFHLWRQVARIRRLWAARPTRET